MAWLVYDQILLCSFTRYLPFGFSVYKKKKWEHFTKILFHTFTQVSKVKTVITLRDPSKIMEVK